MEFSKEDAEFHLPILGQRDVYCLVAKNHKTDDVQTSWLTREEIIPWAQRMNSLGYQVWISINDKEVGNDSNEGVKSLGDFFIDVDSERLNKNVAATEAELLQVFEKAKKIKDFLEQQYGAETFLACSGNGWHIHCPLPPYNLPTLDLRDEVNLELKNFGKNLAEKCSIKLDSVFDLRRVSTLVGTMNLKIPDTPRKTFWYKREPTINIEELREKNRKLLSAILSSKTIGDANADVTGLKAQQVDLGHFAFETLLESDSKLKDLHNGVFTEQDFQSRSEAEQSLLVKLVQYGFSDKEIYAVMDTCKIGKWQERDDSYRPHSIMKAREFAATLSKLKKHHSLENLAQIEDPTFANELVAVDAIASSTSTSYIVPRQVELAWEDDENGEQVVRLRIEPDDRINLQIIDSPSYVKFKVLRLRAHAPTKAELTETRFRTLYKLRVRPPVFSLDMKDDKVIDDKGYEYKSYDIHVASDKQISFFPSSLMRLYGRVLPDQKRQTVTLLVTSVEFQEETSGFNTESLSILHKFFESIPIRDRVEWILDNFEKYSRIVNRRNISLAIFLGFYSPLRLMFDGEWRKCWGNVDVMGDTTTGKAETARKIVRLLKAGVIITAETATNVGLLGTATQIGRGGWIIDWGFLPLYDRKLLCIDGAQYLSKMEWSTMDEAERSGTVVIAKAAKDKAYARTRQIKINNPIDPERARTACINYHSIFIFDNCLLIPWQSHIFQERISNSIVWAND